jgi:exopolysaccharide biosynthesis WecB/TagA/CpsF family protein
LESVARQTVLPALWVIVDDGSSDATPQILAEYATRHAWIKVIRRDDRGFRSVGPGVVDAFYAGFDTIDPTGFDYLCKLDLDLELPERYFETLMERMEEEPRLGTFSGMPCIASADGHELEPGFSDEMSVGMTKFYRTICFLQIGGFVREVMWDGIDCHRARMLGWIAGSTAEVPALRFIHLRPMGSSQGGILRGRRRHGFGQYFMGTGPIYLLASAVSRMAAPPYISGGLAILYGYLRAAWERAPRYPDLRFRSFLRAYQWQMLLFGKRRATARLNARQMLVWDPHRAPVQTARGSTESFRELDRALATVELDGVPIHVLDETTAVDRIFDRLDRGLGGWVVTYNTDILRRFSRDWPFAELARGATINTADGMPLVWAARLAGVALPERVCGADLLLGLAEGASRRGRSVLLVGGDPAAPDSAAVSLRQRYPLLRIAGQICPPLGFEHDPARTREIADAVVQARPDIVFVALGSPKQEWLIRRLRHDLPQTCFLGVGAAFSFLTGDVPRAPRWMRELGLEWLHRLRQEPARLFRRYVIDDAPYAVGLLLRTSLRRLTPSRRGT